MTASGQTLFNLVVKAAINFFRLIEILLELFPLLLQRGIGNQNGTPGSTSFPEDQIHLKIAKNLDLVFQAVSGEVSIIGRGVARGSFPVI